MLPQAFSHHLHGWRRQTPTVKECMLTSDKCGAPLKSCSKEADPTFDSLTALVGKARDMVCARQAALHPRLPCCICYSVPLAPCPPPAEVSRCLATHLKSLCLADQQHTRLSLACACSCDRPSSQPKCC
ncbi:uncharacterized protein UBRO_20862 [Ustilago bromivora]|uniref:Uncharacterized protein n=1 Tax=Ustilago bromivora TaxID=307758 RepID=A0A1K0GAJ6_9BASI|nr:uncharacterized protein UBRO_20862 [Ustilago bromivora]